MKGLGDTDCETGSSETGSVEKVELNVGKEEEEDDEIDHPQASLEVLNDTTGLLIAMFKPSR